MVPAADPDTLSPAELKALVVELLAKVAELERTVAAQREEIARLKGLKGRPPIKPSGMEQASEPKPSRDSEARRRRGKVVPRVPVEERVLRATVPPGSQFRGYQDFLVQDLVLRTEAVRYRRERWLTPEGQLVVAPLPGGIDGHFGPELRRYVLAQYHQGQTTVPRLVAQLRAVGIAISKRQVVRLLTTELEPFAQEDRAVLQAGLVSSPYITVDDTGARHARRPGVTTQIGGERFCVFRTSRSKSRLNFLSLLRAGREDYVVNEAALDYLRAQPVEGAVIARLAAHPGQVFHSQMEWWHHLARCSINIFDRPLLQLLNEAATWGALRHHGLMANTVVVSDDAGQFRVATHALCWVHAERHLEKLMPASPKQAKAVELVRAAIWCFYRSLKLWKQSPSPGAEASFQRQFNRIFGQHTGYKELDELLARLARRKAELLRVLERPEIPLHTNASENDLRAWVIKRKVSGGTMSVNGRVARDVMLGLSKTCRKLRLSFFDYLGDRLGLHGDQPRIPPLAGLVTQA